MVLSFKRADLSLPSASLSSVKSNQLHFSSVILPFFCLFLTAAAASKSLQLRPTLCDPIDGSPPGSPSLGFSRQEQWSGLPFPSAMHESEK